MKPISDISAADANEAYGRICKALPPAKARSLLDAIYTVEAAMHKCCILLRDALACAADDKRPSVDWIKAVAEFLPPAKPADQVDTKKPRSEGGAL